MFDSRTLRVLFTIGCVAAVVAFLYGARRMVLTFLFAIFFAYLVEPLVLWAERRITHRRGLAILAVYAGGLIALAILGFAIGPRLADQARHLTQSAPAMYQKLTSGEIAWTIGSQRGWSYEKQLKLQQFLAAHQQQIMAHFRAFAARVAALAANAWLLILVPILGVFFLKDGRHMADAALELASRRKDRRFLEAVVHDVNLMLASFIRAQLILAALSAFVYTVGLLTLRVEYAFVLGALGGLLEFIPVVGPLAAALGITGVALATGFKHILLVVIFLAAWRLMQDYVISPRIMGKQVELHPLAALFGILAGAEIAGVIGVYLSIPIMATLRIVWRQWRTFMERPQVITPVPALPSDKSAA